MGQQAERLAIEFNIGRDEQDAFAERSQQLYAMRIEQASSKTS